MNHLKKIFLNLIKKLTVVDYLIIILILLAGIIAYKFFNPEEKWIYLSVVADNVPFFQAQSLRVGDFEKDPAGRQIAQITDLNIFTNSKSVSTTDKDLLIRTKSLAKINPRSGEYEYKNKIVKIGSPIDFRFSTGQISGKISNFAVEESNLNSQKMTKILSVKAYGQWPWIADGLKIGNGEKDESDQNIIELVSKEVEPAQITVVNANGQTLLQNDPTKVDLSLKLKVIAREQANEFIFRQDEKIAIGVQLSFYIGNVWIKNAFITSIE